MSSYSYNIHDYQDSVLDRYNSESISALGQGLQGNSSQRVFMTYSYCMPLQDSYHQRRDAHFNTYSVADRPSSTCYTYSESYFQTDALALKVTNKTQQANDKVRLLPCRTFVSTGYCPYGEKCVFLHDPRIATNAVTKLDKLRKSKEETTIDSFFWTPMSHGGVAVIRDERSLPHVSQHYSLDRPDESSFGKVYSKYAVREFRTAQAVYSMWNNFLDVLKQIESDSISSYDYSVNSTINPYTGKKRLDTFIMLSNGVSPK